MKIQHTFTNKLLLEVLLGSSLAVTANMSFAQDATNLGTVQTSAGDESAAAANPNSAPYQAPTQAPVSATEPTSVINQHYIQENGTAAGNFSDIAQIAPSVWSVDPNGPGGMESQAGGPFVRGFDNGHYNVTFDGIPWGDSNDFTQHSTSYFMPQDTGSISVNRGPGTASTIGWAPFGGTIATTSKTPSSSAFFMPYVTLGSWNTHLVGAEFDTGVMPSFGNASMVVDYKIFDTDGYLTHSDLRRENLFTKFVAPISDNTVVTVMAMQNRVKQNVPYGATQAEVSKYGYNFGLSDNPASGDYAGYNYDKIHTDFEYVDINSQQGNWNIDNKLYTDAYYHSGWNGAAPLDRTDSSGLGTVYSATDVPGQHMNMNYRSTGDLLRLTYSMSSGVLKTGLWYDYQTNNRFENNTDMTLWGAPNATDIGGTSVYGTSFTVGCATNGTCSLQSVLQDAPDRLMNDSLTTIQPYVEYVWKATKQLTVTPGVKYISFKRNLDATVNDHTMLPLSFSHNWTKAVPSLDAHYQINKNLSAYAQYAKGFLAPKLQLFGPKHTSAQFVDAGSIQPEQTTNYQVGMVWASQRLALAADIYDVKFDNEIVVDSAASSATTTVYKNDGGTTYKGFETEVTYYIGSGFSVYGNYSSNSARQNSTGTWIDQSPNFTNALGVIFNQGPMYASLTSKTVGSRYSGANDDNGNDILLPAYTIINLSASYTFGPLGSWGKSAKLSLNVNNLANKQTNYAFSGQNDFGTNSYTSNDWFWTPERSYQLNLAFKF